MDQSSEGGLIDMDVRVDSDIRPRTVQQIRDMTGGFLFLSCSIHSSIHSLYFRKLTCFARLGKEVDKLLQNYGLKFDKEAFLPEKKIVYLRHVGVSREMMHLVLD